MARKRLSDLLREEVKKTEDGDSEAAESPEVGSQPNEDAAPKAKGFAKTNKTKRPPENTEAIAESVENVSESPESSDATAALEAKIAELQEALAQGQKREEDLQQDVTKLKAELKSQTTSAQELQTKLEKAEEQNQRLEAELAQTKQTALQLADSNADLKQQLENKQSTQTTKPPSSAPLAPATNKPASSSPLSQQEILRRRQADSLAHPVFPSAKSPGEMSDRDLGWFD